MRIYIAGPYSAPTQVEREVNTERAIRAGIILMQKGHQPYIPHLLHFLDQLALPLGVSFTWQDYMDQDKAWLRQCEALLYLGSSRGADMELALAYEWGLTIYRDLLDVPLAGVAVAKNPSSDGLKAAVPVAEIGVTIQRLPHACEELPAYATAGSAALDLRAATRGISQLICPGEVKMIPTGLCVAIPPGYAGLVLARSGLASRSQVVPVNQPGLIDPDFRGEIQLAMHNQGSRSFVVASGDRLAQLLLVPYPRVVWNEVAALEETERGSSGWGSTGQQ